MLLRSIRNHCFPPATYIGPFPFFIPLFVPDQHFPSIFFDPFMQSLPALPLDFLFPFPLCSSQFFAPFSPILQLKSLPKSIRSSLFSFIASSTRLLVVFISLLYLYCHYFPPFISYMNFFAMHLSSSPFSCRFSLIPNFTTVIISPGSSFLFLFSFCPLTFPVVLFR
jgi:hypothetical protein